VFLITVFVVVAELADNVEGLSAYVSNRHAIK
jgi:hypothetical protein